MRPTRSFLCGLGCLALFGAVARADDTAQAVSAAQSQLAQAQQMADAALARQATNSTGSELSEVDPGLGPQAASSTHHTMGELVNSVRLGPPPPSATHHSMDSLL